MRPATALGLSARTRRLSGTPVDLLGALGPDGFAWLGPAGPGIRFVTAGVAARLVVGTGEDRIERAADEAAALLGAIDVDDEVGRPGTGPLAVGALPFESSTPGELIVPALVVGIDGGGDGWVTEISDELGVSEADAGRPALAAVVPAAGAARVTERPGRDEWVAAVRRALDDIGTGALRKVVLAREVLVEGLAALDRVDVLRRLLASHPSCYTYAAGPFVGATPELLVARRGGEVVSQPMAGTVPRGATEAEDSKLRAGLVASAKDAEEHRLLVDEVVAALASVCSGPPAAAPADVVALATVSHLATRVTGTLRSPAPSALTLAGLFHPTPAVGGLPRKPALDAIAELEPFSRGLYAGPVGWVDAAGDGEWAVALRGATLNGTSARLLAGAGIVAGSDPAAEWAETEAKLAPMLRALGVQH